MERRRKKIFKLGSGEELEEIFTLNKSCHLPVGPEAEWTKQNVVIYFSEFIM